MVYWGECWWSLMSHRIPTLRIARHENDSDRIGFIDLILLTIHKIPFARREINQFQRQFIRSLRLFMCAPQAPFDLTIEAKMLYWETNTHTHTHMLIDFGAIACAIRVARYDNGAAYSPIAIRQNRRMARTQTKRKMKPNYFVRFRKFCVYLQCSRGRAKQNINM